MSDLNFICDTCQNITDNLPSFCKNCMSEEFSDFGKGDVSCSKCDVLIESGWDCKVYDGSIFCTNCDY